jgi:hypothetical protein
MELPTPKIEAQKNLAEPALDGGVTQELREYVLSAKQKRPYGIMLYEEIGHVVLELLPLEGRIHRDVLVKKTAAVLEFEEVAFKRIYEAIRRLQDLKKICADSDYFWRPKS